MKSMSYLLSHHLVNLHAIPEEVVANANALIEQANIEMGRVPPPGAETEEQKE